MRAGGYVTSVHVTRYTSTLLTHPRYTSTLYLFSRRHLRVKPKTQMEHHKDYGLKECVDVCGDSSSRQCVDKCVLDARAACSEEKQASGMDSLSAIKHCNDAIAAPKQ